MGQDARRRAPPAEHERLVHRITPADGPGSPGGLALPGRARALEGVDQGGEP